MWLKKMMSYGLAGFLCLVVTLCVCAQSGGSKPASGSVSIASENIPSVRVPSKNIAKEPNGKSPKKTTTGLPAADPSLCGQGMVQTLTSLARALNCKVIIHESVEDKPCQVNHQEPPLKQFDELLLRHSLAFTKAQANTLIVYARSSEMASRLYDPVLVKNFYLQNVPASDLAQALQSFLGGGNSNYAVSGIAAGNTLTVRAPLCEMSQLTTLINDIDRTPAEAEIEITVMGVSKETGMEMNRRLTNSSAFTFANLMGGGVFSLLLQPTMLNFLQNSGNTKIFSSTKVRVQHGQQSSFRLGRNGTSSFSPTYPMYPSNGSSGMAGVGNGQSATSPLGTIMPMPGGSYDDGGMGMASAGPGISLELRARIDGSNNVALSLAMNATNAGTTSQTTQQYAFSTNASIPAGATVVLARGDVQDNGKSRSGLPVLDMLPLIGRFFSVSKDRQGTQQMWVTVSANVLRPQATLPAALHLRRWCGLSELLEAKEMR